MAQAAAAAASAEAGAGAAVGAGEGMAAKQAPEAPAHGVWRPCYLRCWWQVMPVVASDEGWEASSLARS